METTKNAENIENIKNIENILEPIRQKHNITAFAGAIVTSKGVEVIDAVGVRKDDASTPITLEDKWPLGACTMTMTATMLARLVEQGKLTWDTTIEEAFPELKENASPTFCKITLLHLLSNHSGIKNLREVNKISFSGSLIEQRRELVRYVAKTELFCEPGTKGHVSPLGYVIASSMAEAITGLSWEDLMRDLLFKPLGMLSTAICEDKPDKPAFMRAWEGVYCSLPDWAKFVKDQLCGICGKTALLKPETYKKIFSTPFGEGFALGWHLAIYSPNTGPEFHYGWSDGHNVSIATINAQKGYSSLFVNVSQSKQDPNMAIDESRKALYKRHFKEDLIIEAPPTFNNNDEFIDYLKGYGVFNTPAMESVFRTTPRHLFLPGIDLEKVYVDYAVVTKKDGDRAISSSSQPSFMAVLLKMLNLKPGHKVLEIGAGTGYNAALMSKIVGESGQIVSIDIDEELVKQAQENVAKVGAKNIQMICKDGVEGYKEAAPYDRIILTVASHYIAPAWLEQLKPDGYLLMPLLIEKGLIQKVVLFRPKDGYLQANILMGCAFMSLRGEHDISNQNPIQLGEKAGLELFVKDETADSIDKEYIYQILTSSKNDYPTTVKLNMLELRLRLSVWLLLKISPKLGAQKYNLEASEEFTEHNLLPRFFGQPDQSRWARGFFRDGELVLLLKPPIDIEPNLEKLPPRMLFELYVCSFGASTGLAQELVKEIIEWDNLGKPPLHETMSIRAYPRTAKTLEMTPAENELISDTKDDRFVISWDYKV